MKLSSTKSNMDSYAIFIVQLQTWKKYIGFKMYIYAQF